MGNNLRLLCGLVTATFIGSNAKAQDMNNLPPWIIPNISGVGGGISGGRGGHFQPRLRFDYPNGGWEQFRFDTSHGRPHFNYDAGGMNPRLPHYNPIPSFGSLLPVLGNSAPYFINPFNSLGQSFAPPQVLPYYPHNSFAPSILPYYPREYYAH